MSFFGDLLRYPFLQYAVAAAVLSSVASGVVGSLVVVRRSTYVAGAMAHCVLGSMGAARFTHRLSTMMLVACGLSLAASLGGLVLSYGPELPVGATTIELAGVGYLCALLAGRGPWRRRVRHAERTQRSRPESRAESEMAVAARASRSSGDR